MTADGDLPGNIGPLPAAMKNDFSSNADSRAQIQAAADKNPNNIMTPFGKNRVLAEKGVDLVTEFVLIP